MTLTVLQMFTEFDKTHKSEVKLVKYNVYITLLELKFFQFNYLHNLVISPSYEQLFT